MWSRCSIAVAVCAASFALAYPASAADIIYEYDALGRLVKVIYPSGQTITYTYDAAGNIIDITVTP
ncbi:MAG: RHS repeat protein [Micropepsaceae bacterium]